MRIVSNPTRCILFFDLKLDENQFKVELDQGIPSGEVKVSVVSGQGVEITDPNLIAIITQYMVQKYIISYDDSDDKPVPVQEHKDIRLDPPI